MRLHPSFARFPFHTLFLALICLLPAFPALAQDADGDGYAVQDGDCADAPTPAIPLPQYVNPGAYDVPGNGIDDDCDGTIDNPPSNACSTLPVFFGQTGLTLAQALDLCQTTVESPPTNAQRTWGLISAQILRASSGIVPGNVQSAALSQFGSLVVPQANATMAAISSGAARDADDPGFQSPGSGLNTGSVESAPANFLAGNGNAVYRAPSCPQAGNQVYDAVRLKLRLRVPTNANGFTFKHRFFSAEWPSVCSQFNDHALCLLTSSHPGIPLNHNILFDALANPMTVQTAFFQHCSSCTQGPADLANTGYDGKAATSWGTTSAPVVPGETIELEFIIWDSSDGGGDALALFDDFQWMTVEQPAGCDDDGDGYIATSCGGGSDCDDTNPAIHPGAAELLDGLDNDCDGLVDEDFQSPQIRSIRDVKPDQGGAVRVRWRADLREGPAYFPQVTGYTLYRRVDGAAAFAAGLRPSGLQNASLGSRAQGDAALALPPGEWDVLNSFPATLDSTYQTVAPTLCDSSSASICWSVFFVRAITDQVGTFYDSPLDSGYSVDNIAPGVPQNLVAQVASGAMQLSWLPSEARDFQYFRVYRSTDPGFTPGPATLVQATAATSWSDPAAGAYTWKITAVDSHGNESAPASASATVAVADVPLAFALDGVRPNPTTSSRMAVTFVLPIASSARLELVDVKGRVIATRDVGSLGAGRHSIDLAGERKLASGIYLVRLTQGVQQRTARVVVID